MRRRFAVLRIWISVLFALGFMSSASADLNLPQVMSALEHERSGTQPGILLYTLGGAGRALTDANAYLQLRKLPKLYCQPPSLALNHFNFADIVLTEYKRDKAFYDQDHGSNEFDVMVHMLLQGLTKTFPCN